MRLTRYTDLSLRVLIYLALRPDRLCAISEIARAYGVSQNHLTKVMHDLGRSGYVESERGRFGGARLARPAAQIGVGDVVRRAERGFDLVECDLCVIAPACGLSPAIGEALAAFMAVLDGYTLEDLVDERRALGRLLSRAST